MGIPIDTPKTLDEVFYSVGVAAALESVFKHKSFEFDNDSREYAEVTRAYWILLAEHPELFSDPTFGSVVPSVVSAEVTAEAARNFVGSEEAVDLLFRRVLLGIHRTYADFKQMSAIRAFDKTRGLFTADHGITP